MTGWWVLPDGVLMEMLLRVADGQDPVLVYMEYYVNSEHPSKDTP